MADLYTVKLQGTPNDLTLEGAEVRWALVQRTYREGESPLAVARDLWRITVRHQLRADTQANLMAAISSYFTGFALKGVQPTYLKILDATGTAIPDIGAIDVSVSSAWESLRLMRELDIDGPSVEEPGELRELVTVQFALEAERSYPDADGVTDLEQTEGEEADENGLVLRRRVTRLRLSRITTNTIAGLASGYALPASPGWVRVEGTNTTSGVKIEYLDAPLKKQAILTSVVAQVGSGTVPPPGTSQAPVHEVERAEDPERGLLVVTTRAEVQARTGAQSWVSGRRPEESVGKASFDKPNLRATGEWRHLEPLRAPSEGKITARRWTRSLQGGGRAVSVAQVYGGVQPKVRVGPQVPFELVEIADVTGLGVAQLADLPTPPGPEPKASWVERQPLRLDSLPVIESHGRQPNQHVGRRQVSRRWLWVGQGSPLSDPAFAIWAMREFTAEETP